MEPYKILMVILLIVLEVPAAVILAVEWVKACKEAKGVE